MKAMKTLTQVHFIQNRKGDQISGDTNEKNINSFLADMVSTKNNLKVIDIKEFNDGKLIMIIYSFDVPECDMYRYITE